MQCFEHFSDNRFGVDEDNPVPLAFATGFSLSAQYVAPAREEGEPQVIYDRRAETTKALCRLGALDIEWLRSYELSTRPIAKAVWVAERVYDSSRRPTCGHASIESGVMAYVASFFDPRSDEHDRVGAQATSGHADRDWAVPWVDCRNCAGKAYPELAFAGCEPHREDAPWLGAVLLDEVAVVFGLSVRDS
jgi:hypothetical protein